MSEKQFLIIGIAVVVLIVGAFGYLTYTEYQELQRIRAETKELDTKIAGHRDRIAKIKALREEINILETEFVDQSEILPDGKELENLLQIISYLCKESGVQNPKRMQKQEARGTAPGAKPAAGGIEEIIYDCEFDGTFFKFVKFLNWLEHYKRLIRVKTFQIRGGGKKEDALAVENPVLQYTLQFVTYEYKAGDGAGTRQREFNVTKPEIPKGEEIEIEDSKRDPFRFSLVAGEVGPGPGPGPTTQPPVVDEKEIEEAIGKLEERIGKLRLRVLKVIGTPQASPEELRAIQAEFKDIEVQIKRVKTPNAQALRLRLEAVKSTVADISKRMGELLKRLYLLVARKLDTDLGDLITGKRYKETVPAFLEFLAEFRDAERDGDMDKVLEAVCARILNALERHIEENFEYDETIKLIEEIKKALSPVINKVTNRVYKDFLERRDDKGELVGGLAQIRKKAEDIKMFKGFKYDLRGVIWQPDPSGRVCIILVPAGLENKEDKRHVLREGDQVGVAKSPEDRVTILEITPFKQVLCGFRGLKIPLLLGEVERAKKR